RHTRSKRDWSSDVCSSDLVKVEGEDKVSMTRYGAAPSQLVVERGKRHVCHYDAGGLGAMSLGIAADYIENQLGPEGGRVRFGYKIGRASCRERVRRAGDGG